MLVRGIGTIHLCWGKRLRRPGSGWGRDATYAEFVNKPTEEAGNPSSPKRFLAARRSDLHDLGIGAQFRWVNHGTRMAIRRLIEKAQLADTARVLDFGCGTSPYRDELPVSVDYVGADIPGNPRATVDISGDGTIPLADGSFDLILSTYTLEHVEEPNSYLAECYRLLRPGGTLALSVPLLMYYHRDPEDYWRWTQAGLRRIVEEAGFTLAEMHGLLGLASAALQLFQDATLWRVPRGAKRLYIVVMQALVRFVDRFYSEELRLENSLALVVRAVKAS
jgi:SAM-dependent methyltransferase